MHWDLFLGTAPERPYNPVYHPHNWRGWWDFGTGSLGDMACHTANLTFMALQLGLPVRVSAQSGEINSETYPAWATITYEFPARGSLPPVKLTWYEGAKNGKRNLPPDRTLPRPGLQALRQRLALDRLEVADVFAQRLWRGPDALARGRVHTKSRSPSPPCLASRARARHRRRPEARVGPGHPRRQAVAGPVEFRLRLEPDRVDAPGQCRRPIGPGDRLQPRNRRDHRQLSRPRSISSPISARAGRSEVETAR